MRAKDLKEYLAELDDETEESWKIEPPKSAKKMEVLIVEAHLPVRQKQGEMKMTTATVNEKRLAKRVENAMDWDTFIKGIPSLHIVSDLHGKNQDGLAIDLDKKHKVAVHEFPNGVYQTVPTLRSENYKELAHAHVMDKIHEVLDGAALGHKVLRHRYTRSSGELHTDIVLDKTYKMDEVAFEKEFGAKYTDSDSQLIGKYRPVIQIKNSFIQSSTILMGFLRAVCSNGMIVVSHPTLTKPIRFQHIGKVIDKFDKGVEQLISGLFDDHVIENMMTNLEAQPIEYQAMIEWMVQYLGKQATGVTVDQFNIAGKDLDDFTNKWVAYNMITWAASNVVESVNRRNKAMAALNMFMQAV